MNILIIGLRDKETIKLTKQHPNLELTFIDSRNITSRSLQNFNKYDHVINICKFASHVVEKICNKHKGFIRLRPTQGYSTVNSLLGTLGNYNAT